MLNLCEGGKQKKHFHDKTRLRPATESAFRSSETQTDAEGQKALTKTKKKGEKTTNKIKTVS